MNIRTGLGLLLLTSTLAWTQASVDETRETSLIYVDQVRGSDANLGNQQSPFKTLNQAVQAAIGQSSRGTGAKVTVLPGIYRESIVVGASSAPVTIEAASAGTAIVSGADVWTGWHKGSGNIYTHSWPYRWGMCAALGGPYEAPIVRRREQIFVNGKHLTQVMSLGEVTVGSFYVDEGNGTVYMSPPSGTNVSSATVEVATRPTLLKVDGAHGSVIRGMTFEYGNGCRQIQPAVIVGGGSSDILLENDQFVWNNAAGLSVGGVSHVTVQSSTANHNGESGMLGQDIADGAWISDEGSYNNWRGAQGAYYGWQAAGGKFFSIHGGTFQSFKAVYNMGKGIHFDTDNMDVTLDNLLSAENFESGLQVEASQGPVTVSNAKICNNNKQVQAYQGGISLVDAAYVTVTSSSVSGNGTSQIILTGRVGGISVTNFQTHHNTQVYNENFTLDASTVLGTGSQDVFRDSFMSSDWPRFVDSLRSNYNTWHSSVGSPFTIPSGSHTFSGWKSVTHQDSHSAFSDPSVSCEVN